MHALTLPRLGQTMESGRIVEWFIDEGASYAEGAAIYSIETDKSVLDVQATLAGTLLRKLAAPEDEVPVGRLVAVAADAGETANDADVRRFIAEKSGTAAEATPVQVSDGAAPTATSPVSNASTNAVRAMPRAKRLAKELGVDLATIESPTGADGMITEKDVQRASEKHKGTPASSKPGVAGGVRKPLSAVQQAMVRHMTRSWAVPQFCQDVEIDAAPLLERRRRLIAEGGDVSLTSVFLDGLVQALQRVPECNATFDGAELTEYREVDAGIAVATSQGLIVPVLKGCTAEFSTRNQKLRDLLARAREGQLRPDDMSGGTVTLSNLGASRVETGSPILNAPQVCLVFVGALVDKPVVEAGRLAIGKRVHVVCVYDHRVIDGVTGARFVDALAGALTAV
jgi:pyruvate dehydrogenase E2 component (dihydrolipoamide acetyltransferase)